VRLRNRIALSALAALALAGCGGGSGGKSTALFRVPSPSMLPTYGIGTVVRYDLGAYRHAAPARNDIVIVHPPTGADSSECGVPSEPVDGHPCSLAFGGRSDLLFIKRVVGLPGDRLKVLGNRVYIGGRRQPEPFIRTKPCLIGAGCNLPKEITVPPGRFYVMGDDRGASADSRLFGPVPVGWIAGRVTAVVSKGGQ
jgi:signal peptidase I